MQVQIKHRGQHPYRHKGQEINVQGYANLQDALNNNLTSRKEKLVSGGEWLDNPDFENWSISERPVEWSVLDVGSNTGTVYKASDKKRTGNFSALLDTAGADNIPGFGKIVGLVASINGTDEVGHTYGIKGYLSKKAGEEAGCFIFINAFDVDDTYIYNFTTESWELGDGPDGPDYFVGFSNASITTDFTQVVDISGLPPTPAGTKMRLTLGGTNLGLAGDSLLYVDDFSVFDEADESTNLLNNPSFETWVAGDALPDNWNIEITNSGGASAEPSITREENRTKKGDYSMRLANGDDAGGSLRQYLAWQQKETDENKLYKVVINSGKGSSSTSPGRLALLKGNPSYNNADTDQWGIKKAFNFNTEEFEDISLPAGWSVSLTFLTIGGTDYDDAMFVATNNAQPIEQITAAGQTIVHDGPLFSGGDLGWATCSVTGGAFDGNDITVLFIIGDFPDAGTLETYLTSELSASAVSVTNYVVADGETMRNDSTDEMFEYENAIPSTATITAGSDPAGYPFLEYSDGLGHGLNDLSPTNHLKDLSNVSSGFGQTIVYLPDMTDVDNLCVCVMASGENDDVAYFDDFQVVPLTPVPNTVVFPFTNNLIDPLTLDTGDYLFDFKLTLGSVASWFNMDHEGAFDSPAFEQFNFTKRDLLVTNIKNASGYHAVERLAAVGEIDMTAVDDTTLFTPAENVTFVPTRVLVELSAIDATGSNGTLSFGTNNPDYNNFDSGINPTQSTNNLDNVVAGSLIGPSTNGTPFVARVSSASTHNTHTVRAYVFGYFIEAEA